LPAAWSPFAQAETLAKTATDAVSTTIARTLISPSLAERLVAASQQHLNPELP
jgi:hypothetical protein